MKAMVLLCVLMLCLLVVGSLRGGLPAGEPTYDTLSKRDDATIWQHTMARLAFAANTGEWQVRDYGLWKTACLPDGGVTLIALPWQHGQWAILDP